MKYKIGVFGSGGKKLEGTGVQDLAKQIGKALGKHSNDIIVITGGCSGLPYIAAAEASAAGADVWGYSPMQNMEQQKEFTPTDDLSIYTELKFIPSDLPIANEKRKCMKYRNVLSTADCDAGIIIAGQWGSLNEFTNLVDMQKIAGVLTGSGGMADLIPGLAEKINKPGQGEIVFDPDPTHLVETLLQKLTV